MSTKRIVCTDQKPVTNPTSHAHIIAVGIDSDGDGYADYKETLTEVVTNIRLGVSYYTKGLRTNAVAQVEAVPCPYHCGETIIRSKADSTTDNNLDYLRRCSWRS